MFYEDEIQAASRLYPRVPQDWIRAVIGAESSYAPVKVPTWEKNAGENSWGPMQILGSTAQWLGYKGPYEGLMDPATGIRWGTAYLNYQIGRYGLDFDAVISAYNRGHADPVLGAGYIQRVLDWLPTPVVETVSEGAQWATETFSGNGAGAGGLLLLAGLGWLLVRGKR